MHKARNFIKDTSGDAVVEATILFPVMIMIFAALVLLAIYLPARGALQRATQYAATAIATTASDTWLYFDGDAMDYDWVEEKKDLQNVYVSLFSGMGDIQELGEDIVIAIERRSLSSKDGTLEVECGVFNRIVYKEVVVTASREFTIMEGLSFIGFPQTITVTATSTAVVQNGDEFVRSMDIAADFVGFVVERFNLSGITEAFEKVDEKISALFGWK